MLKNTKMQLAFFLKRNKLPSKQRKLLSSAWIFVYTTIILLHNAHLSKAHSLTKSAEVQEIANNPFSANCTAVQQYISARGIDQSRVLQNISNGLNSKRCDLAYSESCCSVNMETQLARRARSTLEKYSKEQILKMANKFADKSKKFKERFYHLLVDSKQEFHNMFIRTYGVIYEQNSYVFSDFYKELQNYYETGRVDLTEVINAFFNTLYQKMFAVLNGQYLLDKKYLQCVSAQMKALKPFGDVPDKLATQIKRSFTATRTFGYALEVATETSRKMAKIQLSAYCVSSLMKMQHCGICKGHIEKPCPSYCVSVVEGCLQYLNEFATMWENFLVAMDKLADRMLGSFNIVMVVEPISIKISEAIMDFQDSGSTITHNVFKGCGRPPLGRLDRSDRSLKSNITDIDSYVNQGISETPYLTKNINNITDILDIDSQPNKFLVRRRRSNLRRKKFRKMKEDQIDFEESDSDYTTHEPLFDQMIRDIRQHVKKHRKFWLNLPQQVCNVKEILYSAGAKGMCWNGYTIVSYNSTKAAMHSPQPQSQPQPQLNEHLITDRQVLLIRAPLLHLKNAENFLRLAYNGQDVFLNEEDEEETQSGEDYEKNTDDDEEDFEGSGLRKRGPDIHIEFTTPSVEKSYKPSIHTNEPAITTINITGVIQEIHNNSLYENNTIGITEIHSKTNIDNDNDNEILIEKESSDGTASKQDISFRQCLVIYILPMYMAWFGNFYIDVLQFF